MEKEKDPIHLIIEVVYPDRYPDPPKQKIEIHTHREELSLDFLKNKINKEIEWEKFEVKAIVYPKTNTLMTDFHLAFINHTLPSSSSDETDDKLPSSSSDETDDKLPSSDKIKHDLTFEAWVEEKGKPLYGGKRNKKSKRQRNSKKNRKSRRRRV